ncbi:VOC family protein [Polaromonas sp.]|uniref:VOC family protein n=1 Tax=Polaromonas sp. TaxID=1869339 RepID=UPI003266467E
MFANQDAMATIAVKDIEAARQFYGQTLGLIPLESGQEGVLSYRSGKAVLLVYVSQFAGTNQATSATWSVGNDFDSVMAALRAKGVVFERYDMPGMSFKDGVHATGDFRGAWFKDPDGNVLHVLNQ